MPAITPHSRPGKLAILDGRRAEAKRLKELHGELLEHVGGQASKTQAMLIGRAAMLLLRIELADRQALQSGSTETDAQYLGMVNTASRMLTRLGLKGAGAKVPTLAEHLAAKAAA